MKKTITETIPYDTTAAVKKLARERVGQPPGEKVIAEKTRRKKAKHKKQAEAEAQA